MTLFKVTLEIPEAITVTKLYQFDTEHDRLFPQGEPHTFTRGNMNLSHAET